MTTTILVCVWLSTFTSYPVWKFRFLRCSFRLLLWFGSKILIILTFLFCFHIYEKKNWNNRNCATNICVKANISNCTLSKHTQRTHFGSKFCLRLHFVTHPWPPKYCNVIVFRRHQRRCHDCRQLSQLHVPSDRTDLRLNEMYWVKVLIDFNQALTNTIVFAQNIVFDESTHAQILPQNFRTELRPILRHFFRGTW